MTIPQASFFFGGLGERTLENKEWVDIILPSKTTAIVNRQAFTRNKTAAFLEGLLQPTAIDRAFVRDIYEALAPSKTTGDSDIIVPEWVSATLDETSCNGDIVTVDLEWDIHGYTGWTINIERRNITTWGTVIAALSAGSTTYSDTGASVNDTNRYRIKFNVTGADWIEKFVSLICPE